MAGVVGAGVGGPAAAGAGPISAAALHAVLLHTFTAEAGQRKVRKYSEYLVCYYPVCGFRGKTC